MSPRAAEGSQKGGASIEATMATHEVTMATLTPSSGKGGAEAPLALQSTTPLTGSTTDLTLMRGALELCQELHLEKAARTIGCAIANKRKKKEVG